jgi:hypothetical protein
MMGFMFRFWAIVCICLAGREAGAAGGLSEIFKGEVRRAQVTPTSVSASGQFVIHGAPPDGWRPMALSPSLEADFARLDAPLLAVSCERIKSALLAELGARDQWSGKISIFLHLAHRLDETIVVGSSSGQGDRAYYVNLPDTVERKRLVAAMTDVMLMEMANRQAARSAEIPAWLAQGLTQQLTRESMAGLVMEPPKEGNQDIHSSTLTVNGRGVPPLELAHEVLQARPPLTIDELSWPRAGQEEDEVYRSCAQLLVCRLLEFPDGRACMQNMIHELPQHLNWQISFLDAFHNHFASELELEKWWALCLVNFTGRDLAQAWPRAESWKQLDEVIHTGAQVRTTVDELPLHTEVTLQSIIGDWGYVMQEGVLSVKIRQLQTLRVSVSQDMTGLVDDYRQVLENYMKIREKSGAFRNTKAQRALGPDKTAIETIQLLNALDAEREALRNAPDTTRETAAAASVNR